MTVIAEEKRRMISAQEGRLAAAKARGVKLGQPKVGAKGGSGCQGSLAAGSRRAAPMSCRPERATADERSMTEDDAQD
jgi:hypothetical protein